MRDCLEEPIDKDERLSLSVDVCSVQCLTDLIQNMAA